MHNVATLKGDEAEKSRTIKILIRHPYTTGKNVQEENIVCPFMIALVPQGMYHQGYSSLWYHLYLSTTTSVGSRAIYHKTFTTEAGKKKMNQLNTEGHKYMHRWKENLKESQI